MNTMLSESFTVLPCVSGHGLWLKQHREPVFQVDGETSPALAGFYVFWTMIIVLQVLSVCLPACLSFCLSVLPAIANLVTAE